MFSKTCEYGIRSCIYIACQSLEGKRPNLQAVSKMIESPEAFTAKIIRKLVKNKIVKSSKGPGGGFEIDLNTINSISLYQIIETLDGDVLNRCSLGLKACSEVFPCPFHHQYKPVKQQLINLYSSTSLLKLAQSCANDSTFLKV